ncbi:MAG: prepilin peptidase, partial [Acidobacteriota bacterium]
MDWSRIIPPWFFPAWSALLGLVLGSFANVCIHRLPRHESLVFPGSACPRCGTRIRARDNVPVLSWLLLRGRCHACHERISARYPLVEMLTGVLFLALSMRLAPGPAFAVAGGFALALLILFFTDLETMLLPDVVTLGGLGFALATAPWNPLLVTQPARTAVGAMIAAAIGAVGGGGLVLAIVLGWRLWVRGRLGDGATEEERSGMGWGDLKMLAMIGAFVGIRQVFFVTFLAAMLGSLVGGGLMIAGRGSRRTALPFGTFLAVGGLLALTAGLAAEARAA